MIRLRKRALRSSSASPGIRHDGCRTVEYGAAAAPSQFFGQPVVALQLVTAGASIGRVSTSNYIISRNCNALALGAVAVDFAVKLFLDRPDR